MAEQSAKEFLQSTRTKAVVLGLNWRELERKMRLECHCTYGELRWEKKNTFLYGKYTYDCFYYKNRNFHPILTGHHSAVRMRWDRGKHMDYQKTKRESQIKEWPKTMTTGKGINPPSAEWCPVNIGRKFLFFVIKTIICVFPVRKCVFFFSHRNSTYLQWDSSLVISIC